MDPIARTEALVAEVAFVHRLARALVRDAELAHDVAQDTLLAAHQQSVPPRSLRDWLATVARRLATKRIAAKRRREMLFAHRELQPVDESERTREQLQLQQRVAAAVLSLAEPYRTAVRLRFLDEFSPRAIAQRTGVTSDVVRQRVHRGLQLLRVQLDHEFGDRAAWATAFSSLGLGSTAASVFFLPVVLMKKPVLAAALSAVALSWWWLQAPPAAPSPTAARAVALTPASVPADDNAAAASLANAAQRQPAPPLPVPELTLLVVDAKGAPVGNAECHTFADGSEEFVSARTNGDGRCRFAAKTGAGGIVVFATHRAPFVTSLPARTGEQRVVLPDGGTLLGRLLVDGQPGSDWPLRLLMDRELPPMPQVLAKLAREGLWQSPMRTAADGSFACLGIPSDAKVTLHVKKPLLLLPESGGTRDRQEALAVAADGNAIDLHTTLLPGFTVRVLWADSGEPVAGANVGGQAEFSNGELGGNGTAAERGGLYHLGFGPSYPEAYLIWCAPAQRPSLVGAVIEASAPGSAGSVRQWIERDDVRTGEPIVLRLPRAKVTHFIAIDTAGHAIAGASAQALVMSAPTDAEGRGTFVGTPRELRAIGSPTHLIRPQMPRAAAKGTADDPCVYVLERDNTLHIRLQNERGAPFVMEPSSQLRVAIESADWLLAGDRYHLQLDEHLHGWAAMMSGQKETQLRVHGAEAVVRSVTPDRECTIVVRDLFDDVLGRATTRTPVLGEESTITVTLAGAPFARRCTVVNAMGQPISGAGIGKPVTLGSLWRTDAQGTALLRGYTARANMEIAVVAPGFASQRLDLDLRSDAPLFVRLQRGQVVMVRVVDEHGAPVDTYPWLDGNDVDDHSENVSPGCRRFPNLPLGVVTFACGIGAARFRIQHDSHAPLAMLRVPRPGSLRVACPAWPQPGDGRFLVAIAQRLAAEDPPTEIRQPDIVPMTAAPQPLVPGRYRVTLVVRSRGDAASHEADRAVANTEVDVRAGETATATLR